MLIENKKKLTGGTLLIIIAVMQLLCAGLICYQHSMPVCWLHSIHVFWSSFVHGHICHLNHSLLYNALDATLSLNNLNLVYLPYLGSIFLASVCCVVIQKIIINTHLVISILNLFQFRYLSQTIGRALIPFIP